MPAAPRHPEHLGPLRRRPLLHPGPARRGRPELDAGRRRLRRATTTTPVINPLCIDVRSGGYFPADLRGLYDITGHGFDGTGQTIGFTLWTARRAPGGDDARSRPTTGDQLDHDRPELRRDGQLADRAELVHDADRRGRPPAVHPRERQPRTTTSARTSRRRSTSRRRTASPRTSAMKYYASDCASTTPPGSGLTNAGCNGTDVGLEEAIEDAANDPTLHSVSNSWAFGGEAEWGADRPVPARGREQPRDRRRGRHDLLLLDRRLGHVPVRLPVRQPARRRASAARAPTRRATPATWSTSTTWSGGGSWCSNVFARPAWQTGAGVTANAPCPGRVIPDVSAIADPNTGVRFVSTHERRPAAPRAGQVGGTSLAAPVMNGLQAVTQNFVNAQTYPGATPQMGFVGAGALPARQQRPTTRATSATSSAATPPTRRAGPTATPRPRAGTPRPAGASPTGSTSASATRCSSARPT